MFHAFAWRLKRANDFFRSCACPSGPTPRIVGGWLEDQAISVTQMSRSRKPAVFASSRTQSICVCSRFRVGPYGWTPMSSKKRPMPGWAKAWW